jgi:hypothetical protein
MTLVNPPAEPMSDDDFQAVVAAAIKDAVDYAEQEIAPARADAIDRYLGNPYGDEKDGRSKVVATEVRDTVEAIMPSLLRVFASAERAVEFVPRGPEDVASAEQATDYVNWIWQSDNPGFQILQTWLKDGLLCKVGAVKFWHDERTEVSAQRYSGLTDDDFLALASDPSVDEVADEVDTETGLHAGELRRRSVSRRVRVEAIPPEEFIIARDARSEDDAALIGHRREVTVSDLVAWGYDRDDVESLAGASDLDTAGERLARRDDGGLDRDASPDPSQRKVLYCETYIRADRDGDGVAELRRVCTGGTGYKVLFDEPWDDIPFACWTPVPLPHVFYGLSVADLVLDLQRIKTVIMRQVLDNLVLANNPRMAVVTSQVTMDDVLNDELGAIYRVMTPGAIQPLSVPFVAGASLPVLDYLDAVKEQRTGMSRASQGLDADALQSTTAAAVTATISAAQGKIELLARIFAETGLKRLFRGILRLVVTHQDRARVIRLRNAWVPIDPRSWDAEMDVTVNVGLGRGSDDDRLQALGLIRGAQEQILVRLGPQNPLVTLGQYRNTLAAMLEIAGFKDAGRFFKDPDSEPPQPPAPPPPDPKLLEAQARVEVERFKAQAEVETARMRAEAEASIKREAAHMEHQRRLEQMQAEFGLRREQMRVEAELAAANTVLRGGGGPADAGSPVRMGGEVG